MTTNQTWQPSELIFYRLESGHYHQLHLISNELMTELLKKDSIGVPIYHDGNGRYWPKDSNAGIIGKWMPLPQPPLDNQPQNKVE